MIQSTDQTSIIHQVTDNEKYFSLMSGNLSNALLWGQVSVMENSEEALNKCFAVIRQNIDYVQTHKMTYKLSIGVTGLAWVMQFLEKNKLLSKKDCQNLDEIDIYIGKTLKWNKVDIVYDLLQGIIGKGLYFIERDNDKCISYLKDIVSFLDETSIAIENQGIVWPDYYTAHYDNTKRDGLGYYNLGLAHGIPSIIVFLCKLFKIGVEKEKCRSMIRKSVDFILAQKNIKDKVFPYPIKLYPRSGKLVPAPNSQKLGWCYGPLSIAVAFLSAYDVLGDRTLYKEAHQLTLTTSKLQEEEVLSACGDSDLDVYLCHGTAGLAYMYFRLNSVFQDPFISKAVSYWKERTYQKLEINKKVKPCGLLDGLTGVCMILNDIESKEDITFQWDKLFLLDQL